MARSFVLQFKRSLIPVLAAQYGYPDDTEAREAGRRIVKGEYSRANLEKIARWKSPRSIGRVESNSDRDIQDALRLAVEARTARAALAILTGLRWIDIPVASAIMAAIRPERFTIADGLVCSAATVTLAGGLIRPRTDVASAGRRSARSRCQW
jgi:hypothetical protein